MDANANRKRRKERRAEAVAEYKTLTRKLKSLRPNDDASKIQELISKNLDRGAELYPIVKKKLDGASADSSHLRELVSLGHEASKRINAVDKPFELKVIIRELMRDLADDDGKKLNKRQFNRWIVDNHASTFLCSPPSFQFFYGALKSEGLEIKERRRKIREKFVEAKTVTAKEKNVEIDVEQDSTPKEVEHINRQIVKLARTKTEGVPFFNTLVDPDSFAQTVENIFHTSFLVKEGKVGVRPDIKKKAILTVEGVSNQSQEVERRANGAVPSQQSILSFSMEDYKDWISKFNIKKRAFAPRKDHQGDEPDE